MGLLSAFKEGYARGWVAGDRTTGVPVNPAARAYRFLGKAAFVASILYSVLVQLLLNPPVISTGSLGEAVATAVATIIFLLGFVLVSLFLVLGYLGHFRTAEVRLAEKVLARVRVPRAGPGRPREKPERLIADRAYNSDAFRKGLGDRGIEPVIPHRRNRKKPATQDGRKLRRYRRRWIVERTMA